MGVAVDKRFSSQTDYHTKFGNLVAHGMTIIYTPGHCPLDGRVHAIDKDPSRPPFMRPDLVAISLTVWAYVWRFQYFGTYGSTGFASCLVGRSGPVVSFLPTLVIKQNLVALCTLRFIYEDKNWDRHATFIRQRDHP